MLAKFLRPLRYHGDDDSGALAARQVSIPIEGLSQNPLLGGRLFELQDFSQQAQGADRTYLLRHKFGSKVSGIIVVECRPKYPTELEVPTYPTHAASNDTKDVAFIAMSPYMAQNFLWSFWVW